MEKRTPYVGVFAALLLATAIHAEGPALTEEARVALEIGGAILVVDQAMQYEMPEQPTPEQVVKAEKLTTEMVRVGQITRLYPWVSARLAWEIQIAEHLLRDTHPEEARSNQLAKRIKYLQRVKLLIDAPL